MGVPQRQWVWLLLALLANVCNMATPAAIPNRAPAAFFMRILQNFLLAASGPAPNICPIAAQSSVLLPSCSWRYCPSSARRYS